MPKNTTQCPRPGLEPGPLDLGTSALTMRPPQKFKEVLNFIYESLSISALQLFIEMLLCLALDRVSSLSFSSVTLSELAEIYVELNYE